MLHYYRTSYPPPQIFTRLMINNDHEKSVPKATDESMDRNETSSSSSNNVSPNPV